MKTSSLFQPKSPEAIDRLIADHPFAQVISTDRGQIICTPLPLLLERTGDGGMWLIGHFARANPHVEALRREPKALAVFMGVHGYISPSWMRDRTQAPTWNYETAHFEIEVVFDDSPASTHKALERLVNHVEQGRPQAWTTADMGARYERLAAAVVAFRARVMATHAKFKLGQNERPNVYADILEGLSINKRHDLIDAMKRANQAS